MSAFPRQKILPLLALATLILPTACSVQPRGSYIESQHSPELVHAESWDSMTLTVGGARTKLENNGHFTTMPNACYRKESGALELELWNRVALVTNRLLGQQWTEETNCQDRPAGSPDLSQPVMIQLLNQQTKELLSSQGARLCSNSVDLESASELMVLIGEVARRASQEGCPSSGRR
ncbi:hypothetical protein EBZ37_07680 [bacterium]|nr:hypothetical protein [bacterium]